MNVNPSTFEIFYYLKYIKIVQAGYKKHFHLHRCYPFKDCLSSNLTLSMLEMRLITRTEVLAVTRCVGNIGSNMEGKCFTEDLCYRDLYTACIDSLLNHK